MMYRQSQQGAAMLLFVLFFTFATSATLFILGQSIFADLSDFARLTAAKESYLASESVAEDVAYRLIYGTFDVDTVELVRLNNITAYATTSHDFVDDIYTISAAASKRAVVRKSELQLSIGAGSAFNYGLQAGNGGIALSNGADIFGNVYSNGAVTGAGSATVFGELVSAGPTGLADGVYATGTIYANTIDSIDTDSDAYYNVALGSNSIAGVANSPAAIQPTTSLPISTTTVQEWKDAVTSYGTTIAATDPACSSGTYTIDISTTIGYLKVECDLNIRDTGGGVVVTLDGPIWVEGNLSFTQGPTIRVDSSLGRRSVQFIVDNEADRTTSSQIEIRNSTTFQGSGDDRSYIMLMSLNDSSRSGGSEVAIDVSQSANGDVLVYAGDGLIEIGNNIDLRAVTGHQIDVANGSSITYETGLASLLFTSGPGGGYTLDAWRQAE